MLTTNPSVPIYLHSKPIDMLKSFDGLFGIITHSELQASLEAAKKEAEQETEEIHYTRTKKSKPRKVAQDSSLSLNTENQSLSDQERALSGTRVSIRARRMTSLTSACRAIAMVQMRS
jgi:hypothetical protein